MGLGAVRGGRPAEVGEQRALVVGVRVVGAGLERREDELRWSDVVGEGHVCALAGQCLPVHLREHLRAGEILGRHVDRRLLRADGCERGEHRGRGEERHRDRTQPNRAVANGAMANGVATDRGGHSAGSPGEVRWGSLSRVAEPADIRPPGTLPRWRRSSCVSGRSCGTGGRRGWAWRWSQASPAGWSMGLLAGAVRTSDAYRDFSSTMKAADAVVAGRSAFGLAGAVDLDDVERLPQVRSAARATVTLMFTGRTGDGRRGRARRPVPDAAGRRPARARRGT